MSLCVLGSLKRRTSGLGIVPSNTNHHHCQKNNHQQPSTSGNKNNHPSIFHYCYCINWRTTNQEQPPINNRTSKNKFMRYPQQLGKFWKVFGYLPRSSGEPHQPSAPEPSGTSSAICTNKGSASKYPDANNSSAHHRHSVTSRDREIKRHEKEMNRKEWKKNEKKSKNRMKGNERK